MLDNPSDVSDSLSDFPDMPSDVSDVVLFAALRALDSIS